jgi:PAS domain S-box-containing protein
MRRGWVGFPDEAAAALARRLEVHRTCEGELLQEFADGRVARIRERRTRDGGIVVVVEDLTEERAAARRLSESEARFEDFARASSDWFWETDAEGRFSYMSEQVLRYGFSPESHLGLSRLDLLRNGDNDPSLVEAHAAEIAAQRPVRRFRHRMRRPGDARQMWIEVDGTPVFSGGVFRGFRGVAREVTAKDEAERSNDSKSRFLATISHEIRTPLNGVVGLLDLLAEDPLPAEALRRIEAARAAAAQLGALVGDVLDLSRLDEGAVELERLPVDVEALCVEVARTFSATASAKGVEVAVSCAPEGRGLFMADPTRLRQIVSNLVGNAVKFTSDGGVLVRIGIVGKDVEVAVRDSGPGIPPDVQARLFRRFAQADASTTREHGGTGLGLAIVAELAALFGGSVSLESAPGEGSVFRVRLPLDRVQAPLHDGRPAEGLRVLVVDDVALNREVLCDQIRTLGGTVLACASAEEAMDAASVARFDIALIDRRMPGMDGIALARALAGRIPALVLCTSLGQRGVSEAPPAGLFRAVLLKPCRTEALAQAILGGTATGGSAAAVADDACSILVAEDNDTNWEVFSGLLARLGRSAVRARTGVEAVEMAQAEAFSLILMDIQMPVMDGVEAVRRIRAGGLSAGARILAVTANVFREDIESYLAAGFDGHLAKPVTRATLARAIGMPPDEAPAQAPTAQMPPPVDADVLRALVGDLDAETVREAADVFFQRFGASALAGFEARGQAAVAASAHTIKGAAGQIGLSAVAAAAAHLERRAKAGKADSADCARLVEALADAEALFPEALRAAAAP